MEPKVPVFGRFSEPSLLILVSLSDGPKHGYAIMQDVESGTGRPMGAGPLYAALVSLEDQGLIEAVPPEDRSRPYPLTAVGACLGGLGGGRQPAAAVPAGAVRTDE